MVLNDAIIVMLITGGFGFLGAVLAILYKSKCTRIECCCLKIDRDVAGEERLDEEALRHRDDPPDTSV